MKRLRMTETEDDVRERLREIGAKGGAANSPLQQEARKRLVESKRGGRPPGAKNKPKPLGLPAWNDEVTIGHRYGEQAVRPHHKLIYQRRLKGMSIERLAEMEGLQTGQIRVIIRRLAERLRNL